MIVSTGRMNAMIFFGLTKFQSEIPMVSRIRLNIQNCDLLSAVGGWNSFDDMTMFLEELKLKLPFSRQL
jgi:hypothetical protein